MEIFLALPILNASLQVASDAAEGQTIKSGFAASITLVRSELMGSTLISRSIVQILEGHERRTIAFPTWANRCRTRSG